MSDDEASLTDPVGDAGTPRTSTWLFWTAASLVWIVAVAAVAVCIWQTLWLGVSIEPNEMARFNGHVGASLRIPAAVGAVALVAGVLFARGRALLPRVAIGLSLASAVAAGAVAISALVIAERRLHPSFDVERAAVRAFDAPDTGAPDIETEIDAHPELTATWIIDADQATTCAAAVKALTTWADPSTVHDPPRLSLHYERVAQRGLDDAELSCVAAPGAGSPVDLILHLTRAR